MFKSIISIFSVFIGLSLFFNVNNVLAASEYEPNDSMSTAQSISLTNNTTSIDGDFYDNYDDDYYVFTLENAGKLGVSINQHLNVQYSVELYNENMKKIEAYHTNYGVNKGTADLFSQGLDKGTYYLKVERYAGQGVGIPYKLKLDFTSSKSFEKEFNNDFSSANLISLNKEVHGFADYESDYFVFEVSKSGELKIDMNRSLQTKYEVVLYSGSRTELERWTTDYSNKKMSNIINIGLPKGTYYLKVRTYEGKRYNVPYLFNVNFSASTAIENEDNDDESRADSLRIGTSKKGIIRSYYDEDYYRLDLSKNTNIALQITNSKNARFYIEVSNPNRTFVQYYYTQYGHNKLKTFANVNLKKGIYYIRVKRYDGQEYKIPYTVRAIKRDTTPPAIPSVNRVTSKTTMITGKAEKSAKLYVYKGTKLLGQGVVTSKGTYSVKIAKQKKGTNLKIYAKDAVGNKSKVKTVKVN